MLAASVLPAAGDVLPAAGDGWPLLASATLAMAPRAATATTAVDSHLCLDRRAVDELIDLRLIASTPIR